MSYVINPLHRWELPVFHPEWKTDCSACAHMEVGVGHHEGLFRCRHKDATGRAMRPCSDVWHTQCRGEWKK